MIEVQNLTKRYGPTLAVSDVSFAVEKGEILGFLGPNGAGKTTTMRVITGYLPPTEGKVQVAGFDVVEQPLDAKRRTGFLPLLERTEQSRGQVFMTATAESWPQETGRELLRWRVKEGTLLKESK